MDVVGDLQADTLRQLTTENEKGGCGETDTCGQKNIATVFYSTVGGGGQDGDYSSQVAGILSESCSISAAHHKPLTTHHIQRKKRQLMVNVTVADSAGCVHTCHRSSSL